MNIAIDLGGTNVKIGLAVKGETLASDSFPVTTNEGLLLNIPSINQAIHNLLEENNFRLEDCSGIGFSFPGIVDTDQTRVLSCNKKYSDALEFDFSTWAFENFKLPVTLENDARCALLGEWQYGAGKDCDNIVMITIGTGIGCATLINGKLLRGAHYQAGCLGGHFIVDYKGAKCTCGNIGCVEAEASTWRLPELAQSSQLFADSKLKHVPVIDYQTIFKLAEQQDELSVWLVNHSINVWTAGIITAIHAYDPEQVIIGGGIMKSSSNFLLRIQEQVNERAWTQWGKVKIREAHFPEQCAFLGAACLAEHKKNF